MSRRAEAEARSRPLTDVARDVLAEAIDDIELRLRKDDPAFVRRMRRLQRAEIANALAIFVLLVASAVGLAVGLATRSSFAWVVGLSTLLVAFGVDNRYLRRLRGRP